MIEESKYNAIVSKVLPPKTKQNHSCTCSQRMILATVIWSGKQLHHHIGDFTRWGGRDGGMPRGSNVQDTKSRAALKHLEIHVETENILDVKTHDKKRSKVWMQIFLIDIGREDGRTRWFLTQCCTTCGILTNLPTACFQQVKPTEKISHIWKILLHHIKAFVKKYLVWVLFPCQPTI